MVMSPYAPNVAKAITNAVKEYSVLHPNLNPAEVMTEFGLTCELKVFVRLLKKCGCNYPKCTRKSGVRDEFLPIRLQWCKKALPLMKLVAAETIMKQRDLELQKSSNESTSCHLGDFVDIFKKLFELKLYDEKLIKNVSLIYPLFLPTFSNVNGVDYGKSRRGATNQNDNHQSSHSKEEIIILHQRQAKIERILNDLMINDIKYWDDIEATLFEDDEYGYGSACGHPYGYGQRQFYGYGFGHPPAYGYDESDDEDGYEDEEKKEEEIDFELEEVLYTIVNGPKEDFIEERIIEAIDNNEDQQTNYEQQHKRQKLSDESSNNKTTDFQYKMELVFVNRFIQPKLYNISFFNIHKRSIEEYLELCVTIYDSEIRVCGAPIDMWHTSSDLQLQALIFAQILSGGSNPPNNLNPSDILINFTKKFLKLSNAIEEVDLKENESLKMTDEDKAKAKGEIFNKFITENIDDLFGHFVDNYKNYLKDNLNFLPFWAPFGPDLDPIAHIWWLLKRLTYRRMVLEIDINPNHESPIEILKKCIKEACNDLSPHIIIKIFLGTSKRIQEAINEDGGHIRD